MNETESLESYLFNRHLRQGPPAVDPPGRLDVRGRAAGRRLGRSEGRFGCLHRRRRALWRGVATFFDRSLG